MGEEMDIKFSLAELPLDEAPIEDGDNSVLASGAQDPTGDELTRLQQFNDTRLINEQIQVDKTAKALYVPFRRELKVGRVGLDVFAVRRALSRAGYGEWGKWGKVKSFFGVYLRNNLKAFQRKHKLKVDGVYGVETHRALMPFFDAYGASLMHAYHPPIVNTTSAKRDKIVAAAMLGYANRYAIHYTQSSWRMEGVRHHLFPPSFPHYEDCSSFSTWVYYVAKASDPNNLNYNGQGYTGTLTQHGRQVSIQSLQPGDLVFYGGSYSVPSHVAIYVGHGRVVSHGGEAGPLLLPVYYRRVNHGRTYF